MARIDWAVVCDMAFFDRHDRLCVVGISTKFVFPELPVALHQVMIAVRLADIVPADEISVIVGFGTPTGLTAEPPSDGLSIQISGDYMLATLRDVPFIEEGTYAFQVAVDGQRPVTIDTPVLTFRSRTSAEVH